MSDGWTEGEGKGKRKEESYAAGSELVYVPPNSCLLPPAPLATLLPRPEHTDLPIPVHQLIPLKVLLINAKVVALGAGEVDVAHAVLVQDVPAGLGALVEGADVGGFPGGVKAVPVEPEAGAGADHPPARQGAHGV